MSRRFITGMIIATLCWSCAQQGSPSGGPRDEDPPAVVESEPPNYSTLFTARKIQITFDEYIVLDNANQELIVSPPMEEKPMVKLRGKTLIVEFEEELKDSTTYTFNFGSAIKDLHEGNKLLNYEYVFSTGEVLDSLSVRGTLQYAEDLSVPEDPITIMLYEDLRDSVPLTDIPLYVGRSDDSGVFSVNNLKADTFKVFALKDGNYNLLFDLPTEEIAFLDSNLVVNAEFARSLLEEGLSDSTSLVADTTVLPVFERVQSLDEPIQSLEELTDSTSFVADTAGMLQDTILPGPDYNSIYIDMVLFLEEVETQYITQEVRDDPRMIQLVFARTLTDSFQYSFLSDEDDSPVEILEIFSAGKDSLTIWLKDSTDFQKDTLTLELSYTVKDTSNLYVTRVDTLLMKYREKKTKKKKGQVKEEEKLSLSTIRNMGEQDINTNFKIDLNVPIEDFRDSLIQLYHIPDSLEIPIPFYTRKDSIIPTRAWIDSEWEPASKYRLVMLPGAVSPIYDLAHDTLDLSFQTRDIEYYGQILLTLENVSCPLIVQLIVKDNVVRQQVVYENGLCTFSYLSPKDYIIKFIHDLNDNGEWDTGKYMKKLQPEPVEFLPKSITVRSNWDHDVRMVLEK